MEIPNLTNPSDALHGIFFQSQMPSRNSCVILNLLFRFSNLVLPISLILSQNSLIVEGNVIERETKWHTVNDNQIKSS